MFVYKMSYIHVEKLAPIGRLLVMAVLGMGQRRYPLHSTPLCHEISYRFFLPYLNSKLNWLMILMVDGELFYTKMVNITLKLVYRTTIVSII